MWQLGKRPGIHHTRRGSKHMSLHAAKNADSAFDCFSRALKALQVSTVQQDYCWAPSAIVCLLVTHNFSSVGNFRPLSKALLCLAGVHRL